MNYVPVGANRIRTNNRFAPNEFAQIKFSTIEFNPKYFPNENKANAIRPYQIHQKFNIVLLR